MYKKYLTVEKAQLLANAFTDSQFNYATLIWMFCQKTLYLKIETVHHNTLIIIDRSNASYGDLLEWNGSTSIHQRHLQFLLTDIYKSTVTSNPIFIWHLVKEGKFHIISERVQCFSFHSQVGQPMEQTLYVFVSH